MQVSLLYHKLLTFVLLIVLAAHQFIALSVTADYWIRTEQYASRCVNKARPAMKCKGKCQMMRKMAEQEKKEESLPQRKTETHDLVWVVAAGIFSAERAQLAGNKDSDHWSEEISQDIPTRSLAAVFHPPSPLVG